MGRVDTSLGGGWQSTLPPSRTIVMLALLACAFTACASPNPPNFSSPSPSCWTAVPAEGVGARESTIEVANAAEFRGAPLHEDRQRNRAWCEAIGPAVIQARGNGPQTPPADSVLVVTWNVHVGASDLEGFIDDLEAGRLTSGIRPPAYLLLLQEVYRFRAVAGRRQALPSLSDSARVADRIAPEIGVRQGIVEFMRTREDLTFAYAPSMRNGGAEDPAEDRGNAIVSSLPIRDLRITELPNERQRRIALTVVADGRTEGGTDWSLQVTNVHLENRSRWRDFFRSFGKGRSNQAAVLLAGLPKATSAVIGGDLNTMWRQWNEKAIRIIQDRFPRPTQLSDVPTYSKGIFNRRIDAMMFHGPVGDMPAERRLDSNYGSDHYPVMGWIVFARDGEAVTPP